MTTQDDTWDVVMEQLTESGEVRLSDLPFDEMERGRIRQVLLDMEKLDWLEREGERATTWRLGPLAEMHLGSE